MVGETDNVAILSALSMSVLATPLPLYASATARSEMIMVLESPFSHEHLTVPMPGGVIRMMLSPQTAVVRMRWVSVNRDGGILWMTRVS